MNYILKQSFLIIAVFLSMISAEVKSVNAQETNEVSPFTVRNISIDVTADSAKEARDKAFRQAQEKSLPILLQQLESSGYDVTMMKQAEAKSLANAIKDFEISNEKISAVRYKGDFVFRYDENLLGHYFYGNYNTQDPYQNSYPNPHQTTSANQPFNPQFNSSQIPAKQEGRDRVLILPFFQTGGGESVLWHGYNPWKDVWMNASTSTVMSPIGDLADIRDINDNEALTYNPEKLARMAERYSADRVIILIGSHENSSLPAAPNQPANGLFRVSIYDTARGRPNFINDIQLDERNYPTFKDALQAGYNRSIEQIYALNPIRSIGNEATYASNQMPTGQLGSQQENTVTHVPSFSGPASSFQGRIEYTSMQDWMKAQKTLRDVDGITNVEVLSLTSREAEIKIHFQGSIDAVATNMARRGYNIQETSQTGRYLIYQSGRQSAYNRNGGIIYR